MLEAKNQEIHEVVHCDQTPLVVNGAEGEWNSARHHFQERAEICPHTGSVDQRRSHDCDGHRRRARDLTQPLLRLELALAVGIDWIWIIGFTKLALLPVHLYRAEEDEALDTGSRCLSRQVDSAVSVDRAIRSCALGSRRSKIVHLGGEMHHSVDVPECATPFGRGGNVRDLNALNAGWQEWRRRPDSATDLVCTAGYEVFGQPPPNEPAGAGDQDPQMPRRISINRN